MNKLIYKAAVCFLSLLFSSAIHVFAGGAQPLWSKGMKTNINWQKVTSLGQVIASTGNGLIGVNTVTGEEAWVIEELKNCPENSYQPIAQTPFVSVSSAEGGKNIYFVDPVEGKILFSSKAAGIEQVSDKFFLYQNNKILIIGTTQGGKNTEMVMVDMAGGKKLWSKSGAFSFTTGAKDLGNNEVLITSAFFASKLNASTGDEIWKSPIDPLSSGMSALLGSLEGFASQKMNKDEIMAQLITIESVPNLFIIAAQKKNEATKVDSKGTKSVTVTFSSVYMAFDIVSGKHKWAHVVELKSPLGISYPSANGLIVCSSSDGNINLLNYADGSKMLGKKGNGLGLKGPGAGVAPLKDGKLLVVSGNGGSSAITILDPQSGLFVFEKPVKIRGSVSYTEFLPKGVLVGTDEEVNFYNTATGLWYMEDALEGGAGLIASNDASVYVFNTKDNLLYSMEANGSELKALSTVPVEFQGKEKAKAIEITANGILITSDQNLALFDTKGAVVFNQYYVAPTISDFKKALLIASAVRAAYYTAAFTTYSAAFGATSQSIHVKDPGSKATKDVTADISRIFGDAAVTGAGYTATYIKMAQQRFKATTQTQDYMLVMTSETKKESKLLQVSKSTGKVMNTIQLGKDKQPIYDVDLVEGKLYYMKEGTNMECYQF